MTEIYKIVNGIALPIMNSLFMFQLNQHNLGNFQELSTEKRNTVNYGLESVTYRVPIIWAKLLPEYKLAGSLTAFKSKIKSWKCEICTCRLCKEYELSLIYLNNKNKSHSLYFHFTVRWNWNVTHIVLPPKKIQKRDNIGIILASIYC